MVIKIDDINTEFMQKGMMKVKLKEYDAAYYYAQQEVAKIYHRIHIYETCGLFGRGFKFTIMSSTGDIYCEYYTGNYKSKTDLLNAVDNTINRIKSEV